MGERATLGRFSKKHLWEILVPATIDENGVEVAYHQKWDEAVRQISGGLIILRTAKGQWQSPDGNLFIEPMIPVRIFCTTQQIHQIADLTASHYQQEAVMWYRLSSNVVIKQYPQKPRS